MPLFYIYSQMLTDSSAEASALGSGPRGRRFKSALSEKRPLIVLLYNSIAEIYNLSRKEACFAPEMPIFRCFFRYVCTTHRGKFGHSMCGFDQILYNSSRKSLWCKTAVRQSEHQSCQNLQYDRDIHGNYSTVGVPLLSRMMLMTHPRFQDVPAQFEIIHFSI